MDRKEDVIDKAKNKEIDNIHDEIPYKKLINNLPGIVFRAYYLDNARYFQFISQGVFDITGFRSEEFTGNRNQVFSDIIHKEDRILLFSKLESAIQNHIPYEAEYRIINKDGKKHWVQEKGQTYLDNRNRIWIEGTICDINKSKHAESINEILLKISEAVNKSRNLDEFYHIIHQTLMHFIDVTNFCIANYDRDKDSIKLPYDVDEIDEYVSEVYNVSESVTLTAEVIQTGKPIITFKNEIIKRIKKANKPLLGSLPEVWVGIPLVKKKQVTGVMITQSYHDPNHYSQNDIEILKAVSEQIALAIDLKQAEEDLRESTDRYRSVIKAAPDPLVVYDIKGNVNYLNKRFSDVFGWKLEECKGKKIDFVPEESMPETIQAIKRTIDGKGIGFLETKRLTKDGRKIAIQLSSSTFMNNRGKPAGSVVILRDITKQKKMEAILKENESRYRSVMEAAPDAIVIYNIEGKITYLNPAFTEVFGWTLEECKGHRLDFVPEENMPETIEAVKRMMKGETVHVLETKRFTKDGRKREIQASSSTFRDSNGIPVGSVVILRDVTEKKKMEFKLKKGEERLRSIMEAAPDPIVIYDMDGLVTYLNPAFTKTFGWSFDKCKGNKINFVPEACIQETIEAIDRVKNGEAISSLETKRLTRDGKKLPIQLSSSTFMDHEGQPIGSVVILRDITMQKKMEADLRESEERFRSVMASSPDPMVVYDMEGKVSYLNRAFTRIFGWELKEVFGQKIDFVPKENWPETQKMIDQLMNRKCFVSIETKRYTKNRETIPVSVSGSIYYNRDHSPIGSVVILQDITLRKKAEEALTKSKETAEAATRSKSQFLANMSHEIRTPMNAIIGLSNLIQKTDLTRKQGDYVKKINVSAQTLLGIINDILDFSKIEAGKLELEHVNFQLFDIIDNLTSMFYNKVGEKGIELNILIKNDVPAALVGDPLRLSQILINLTSNAIKFTDQGNIVIQAKLRNKNTETVRIEFSIMDTGVGLTDDQKSKLFNSFSQADGSTTRKYGGTGLGLSICKRLVEMMDGKIWIDSEPDKGSTFYFEVQFRLQKENSEYALEPPKDMVPINALVVDDNIISRKVMEKMLKSFKFGVKSVNSGEASLKELKKGLHHIPYNIVFMDWRLGGEDGIEISKRIRTDPQLYSIPIILISAFDVEGKLPELAKEAGINAAMIKSANPSLLFDTIMEVLGHKMLHINRRNISSKLEVEAIKKIHGARILLVEDNRINQQVAMDTLESAGIIVEVADNGAEAVKKMTDLGRRFGGNEIDPLQITKNPKTDTFDAILMDIQMPIMDGYSATREIRKLKYSIRNIPIIAMTAHAMKGDREKCLDAGMNDHVSKPIDTKDLFSKLAKWISVEQSEASLVNLKNDIPSTINTLTIDALPEKIAGIDIKKGLKKVGEKQALFKKLLCDFNKDYKNSIHLVRDAVKQQDNEKASRMVHTLKGVSGNIGAFDLFDAAIQLDLAFTNNESIDLDRMIESFETALEQVIVSTETLLDLPHHKDANDGYKQTSFAIDSREVSLLLKELYVLIKEADASALEKVEVLMNYLDKNKFKNIFEQLRDQIDDCEFEEAQETLGILSGLVGY